ncbi:MAG: hypothetical protein J1E78_02060 [Muribaculaceae bacterium]|nr:hypothetical protein [Muribaculaceae bacterium]
MGTLQYIIGSLLTVVMFSSCMVDDMPENSEATDDPTSYYITLTVKIPEVADNGTKSTENSESSSLSPSGKESTIKSATLYFCVENKVVLTFEAEVGNHELSENSFILKAKIEDVNDLTELAGKDVSLYIVANAKSEESVLNHDLAEIKDVAAAKFKIENVDGWPIGKFGTDGLIMPLVNASRFEISGFKNIPESGKEDELIDEISKLFDREEGNDLVYNLGILELERGVARVDFKDNPSQGEEEFTYVIDRSEVKLRLYAMQPFNINKESYLFRHEVEGDFNQALANSENLSTGDKMSADGNSWNWVSSPDWKYDGAWTKTVAKETNYLNYLYPIQNDEGLLKGFEIKNGPNILSSEDKIESLKENSVDADGYRIWRYISENTIPSIELMKEDEIYKYATGIAFTFKLIDMEGNVIQKAESAEEKLPAEIRRDAESDRLVITLKDGSWKEVVYNDKEEAYILTYTAFIAHNVPNDWNPESSLNPMHYGVVRNTVYQVMIGNIAGLPQPEFSKGLLLNIKININDWDYLREEQEW